MILEYSRWRAVYSLVVPALVICLIGLWAASNWELATQKAQGKPLAVVMIVTGLAIWIGGTWPNAILLLQKGIRSIQFAGDGVTLNTSTGSAHLGRLLRVDEPRSLFSYARIQIETERGGPTELITSFLKGSNDRAGGAIATELRAMTRRS